MKKQLRTLSIVKGGRVPFLTEYADVVNACEDTLVFGCYYNIVVDFFTIRCRK